MSCGGCTSLYHRDKPYLNICHNSLMDSMSLLMLMLSSVANRSASKRSQMAFFIVVFFVLSGGVGRMSNSIIGQS